MTCRQYTGYKDKYGNKIFLDDLILLDENFYRVTINPFTDRIVIDGATGQSELYYVYHKCELIKEHDEWVEEEEKEMFKIEEFNRMGKGDDYCFQTLSFMGEASYNMSLAFTLTELIDNFPKELTDEFRDVSNRYHDLQNKVRNLQKDSKED